jgi:hypothetical protein
MHPDAYHLRNSLWCITHYYNPLGFNSRFENFKVFYDHLLYQTTNLLVVEVALREEDFVLHHLHDEEKLLQIVDRSMIWQKERVFNLCLKLLPSSCTKVVWLDCDVLFDNVNWVLETSNLLEHYCVVQPYFMNARLPHTIRNIDYGMDITRFPWGFVDESRSHGDVHCHYLEQQGTRGWNHPGYACGFQRWLLEKHGLYDRCIAGSSDNMIYRAILKDYYHKLIILGGYNKKSLEYYWSWAKPFADDIGLQVAFARDTFCYHLYHGRVQKRQYLSRLDYLKDHFDHGKDLEINPDNGCYRLPPNKLYIRDWLNGYYERRKDDEGFASSNSDHRNTT